MPDHSDKRYTSYELNQSPITIMPESKFIHEKASLVKTLASGAIWVTTGMFLARIIGYAIRAVFAQLYGVERYGFINTALSMIMIFSMIALAGLNTGLPRQVSFYRAKRKFEQTSIYIFSAYKISIISGVVFGFILYLNADFFADTLFRTPELEPLFKIFSLGVPLFVLLEINTSILKGLKRMFQFSLYHDILRFGFILVLVLVFGLAKSSFLLTSASYLISYLLIVIITLVILISNTDIIKFYRLRWTKFDRDLLFFSMPLLLSGIFWMLLSRTDTIIIGIFLDQHYVGLYNAAIPIGQMILMIRQAFSPIILPLLTELLSKNQKDDLSLMYYLSAKWTTILSIPIFISMLFMPQFFIRLIFGSNFIPAAPILQIVILGYFLHTIVGPTSNLLIILGKTKLAMQNSVMAFVFNIIMNIFLIPRYQLIGAAISSASTYLFYNVMCFIQVYRSIHVQPFRLLYLKFVLAGLLPIPILFFRTHIASDPIILIMYGTLYIVFLILLKAVKSEDKIIFSAIRQKVKFRSGS